MILALLLSKNVYTGLAQVFGSQRKADKETGAV